MKALARTAVAFVVGLSIVALFVVSRDLGDDEEVEQLEPDLLAYCIGRYGASARTYLDRPSVFGWHCVVPSPSAPAGGGVDLGGAAVEPIDIDDVCATQFGDGAVADIEGRGWPYRWWCVPG